MTSKNLGNVLIRSDLNVPIRNGTVLDNFRIKKSIEYIEELQNKIAQKLGYKLVDHKLELYGSKIKK